MGKQSNLRPIDPQINGLPAAAVKKEIERALLEMQQDSSRIQFWQFVLNKYTPTFVTQAEQAVEWAAKFVHDRLKDNMFSGDADPEASAKLIVGELSDVDINKSHARHIHVDQLERLGLKIEKLEDDQALQEAVLTLHHCYMHSLSESRASKIIENQTGAIFLKAAA